MTWIEEQKQRQIFIEAIVNDIIVNNKGKVNSYYINKIKNEDMILFINILTQKIKEKGSLKRKLLEKIFIFRKNK